MKRFTKQKPPGVIPSSLPELRSSARLIRPGKIPGYVGQAQHLLRNRQPSHSSSAASGSGLE
ncbi:MAG: hypothetical protein K0R96_1023 [Pantoea agglomerans]|nr:hypothetical protein [Pantoea agglomerans]